MNFKWLLVAGIVGFAVRDYLGLWYTSRIKGRKPVRWSLNRPQLSNVKAKLGIK